MGLRMSQPRLLSIRHVKTIFMSERLFDLSGLDFDRRFAVVRERGCSSVRLFEALIRFKIGGERERSNCGSGFEEKRDGLRCGLDS
jgi:hypothetical protein